MDCDIVVGRTTVARFAGMLASCLLFAGVIVRRTRLVCFFG